MGHYILKSVATNNVFEDIWYEKNSTQINIPQAHESTSQTDTLNIKNSGYLLHDPSYDGDTLLRSEYSEPLHIDSTKKNIFQYSWLPVREEFECSSMPITFKSTNLAKFLGLKNLFCTFSGYAPEIGANNVTGSFKEFEAIGVLTRHGFQKEHTIVLASAGNTGRAFAEIVPKITNNTGVKIIIIVPEFNVSEIWTTYKLGSQSVVQHDKHNKSKPSGRNSKGHSPIKLFYVKKGDYTDAINIANTIASQENFVVEGGVRNIGRRDGMATVFISAVNFIGRIPDHYFQAVGSASGAISTWEAAIRFKTMMNIAGPAVPKLHLAQNTPFTPIIDSWNKKLPQLEPINNEQAKMQINQLYAKVLSNRKPPYNTKGGIYDAMTATQGNAYAISTAEAKAAKALFFEQEKLSLCPSSAVTCACLIKATHAKNFDPNDYVMLNLTGGGYEKIFKDFDVQAVTPDAAIPLNADKATIHRIVGIL